MVLCWVRPASGPCLENIVCPLKVGLKMGFWHCPEMGPRVGYQMGFCRRKIKGQQEQGQQAWEDLRGPLRGPLVLENQSQNALSEVSRHPLRAPLRAIFLSELQAPLPPIVLPLETPTILGAKVGDMDQNPPFTHIVPTHKGKRWK